MARAPRHFILRPLVPWEVEALSLMLRGMDAGIIGQKYGVNRSTIVKLAKREDAKAKLREMMEGSLSTISTLQAELQVWAPRALEGIRAQMDEPGMVGLRAKIWWAEASGHTPLRRLEIKRGTGDGLEELNTLTVEELQTRGMKLIERAQQKKAIETTAKPVNKKDDEDKDK